MAKGPKCARLTQVIADAFDPNQLQDLLEEPALVHDVIDATRLQRIREDMERAAARRLQPHYIESFFLEAFRRLGGTVRQREPRRYEVTHIPAAVRQRNRLIGTRNLILERYERITFDKELIAPPRTAPGSFHMSWTSASGCCGGPNPGALSGSAAPRYHPGR